MGKTPKVFFFFNPPHPETERQLRTHFREGVLDLTQSKANDLQPSHNLSRVAACVPARVSAVLWRCAAGHSMQPKDPREINWD